MACFGRVYLGAEFISPGRAKTGLIERLSRKLCDIMNTTFLFTKHVSLSCDIWIISQNLIYINMIFGNFAKIMKQINVNAELKM